MPKSSMIDRYNAFPALQTAIINLRLARIALDLSRNATTIFNLRRAQAIERKLRLSLAPAMRAHKAQMAYDKARRIRYAHLHARKSRTTETATELRRARGNARDQARTAADTKRANNRQK